MAELEEHKKDSLRRIDELERACAVATKDAQQHESQVSSLHRQLREAQVAVRNAEKEADQVHVPTDLAG
jgi:multidrug resistance efflux pump